MVLELTGLEKASEVGACELTWIAAASLDATLLQVSALFVSRMVELND